ncbi:hypothetical protein D3C80_1569630 [compost metagenome]
MVSRSLLFSSGWLDLVAMFIDRKNLGKRVFLPTFDRKNFSNSSCFCFFLSHWITCQHLSRADIGCVQTKRLHHLYRTYAIQEVQPSAALLQRRYLAIERPHRSGGWPGTPHAASHHRARRQCVSSLKDQKHCPERLQRWPPPARPGPLPHH